MFKARYHVRHATARHSHTSPTYSYFTPDPETSHVRASLGIGRAILYLSKVSSYLLYKHLRGVLVEVRFPLVRGQAKDSHVEHAPSYSKKNWNTVLYKVPRHSQIRYSRRLERREERSEAERARGEARPRGEAFEAERLARRPLPRPVAGGVTPS